MTGRDREGYCPHGVYVGGIGVDWMCGRCESGDDEVAPPPRFDPPVTGDELEELRAATSPVAGRPGWRRDRDGRDWYSATWLERCEHGAFYDCPTCGS